MVQEVKAKRRQSKAVAISERQQYRKTAKLVPKLRVSMIKDEKDLSRPEC